ncbi:MAG: hypothetical protein QME59_00870 [Candidatus Hydrothermarchaeota archaeon]|nr:hypothetical protein [Candidatus Hydrothermarchaeota archaeon]
MFKMMEKVARENPGKYVAISEKGEAILAESREKLFELAREKSCNIKCIGHGIDKRYKHFIY